MNIINHGKWLPYTPAKIPDGLPAGVLWAKRENDGVDWYDYSRDETKFNKDSLVFIAHEQPTVKGFVIGAVVRDVSMLFPANAVVAEIVNYASGLDPQKEFGLKIFDPQAKTIRDWPKHPQQRTHPFELVYELEKRIEALQARVEKLEK